MKDALEWIIAKYYPTFEDYIWCNEDLWQPLFDKHADEYLHATGKAVTVCPPPPKSPTHSKH